MSMEPLSMAASNLPAALTSLIGREREVVSAQKLLARPDVRLLTLTGPGGVGKTRLGLQIAADFAANGPNSTSFISLASVGDSSLVVGLIAHTLGLRNASDSLALARLIPFVRDQRLLLVLDNFEHV